jgi:hypothetical protein
MAGLATQHWYREILGGAFLVSLLVLFLPYALSTAERRTGAGVVAILALWFMFGLLWVFANPVALPKTARVEAGSLKAYSFRRRLELSLDQLVSVDSRTLVGRGSDTQYLSLRDAGGARVILSCGSPLGERAHLLLAELRPYLDAYPGCLSERAQVAFERADAPAFWRRSMLWMQSALLYLMVVAALVALGLALLQAEVGL